MHHDLRSPMMFTRQDSGVRDRTTIELSVRRRHRHGPICRARTCCADHGWCPRACSSLSRQQSQKAGQGGAPAPPEHAVIGKAARGRVALVSHAELVTTGRSDRIELLEGQAVTRVPELVPIRHGRTIATPFWFSRGGALVTATDLARTPN